jgi:hypothetical protein
MGADGRAPRLNPPVVIKVGDQIRLSPGRQIRGGSMLTVRSLGMFTPEAVELLCDVDLGFSIRAWFDWTDFAPGGDCVLVPGSASAEPTG